MHVASIRFCVQWGWCFAVLTGWVGSAHAVNELNDTGAITCFSDLSSDLPSVAADTGSHPRQDCRFGRDVAAATAGQLTKVTVGASAGFDFTKIANDGTVIVDNNAVLGNGLKDWACTRDNVSGLIWEVKTTSGIRSQNNTYTWYSSANATNGTHPGSADSGTCSDSGRCDTEKFLQSVKALPSPLCGVIEWRLPNRKELGSIVDYGRSGPSLDPNYFPNTSAEDYW